MITSIKLCDTNSAIHCAVCGKAIALTPIEARYIYSDYVMNVSERLSLQKYR